MTQPKYPALDKLLHKEVTRKEFLGVALGAVVSLMGFSSIVGLFTKNAPEKTSGAPGYGKQGYGS